MRLLAKAERSIIEVSLIKEMYHKNANKKQKMCLLKSGKVTN